jgi:carbohydrate-selective porin OprB
MLRIGAAEPKFNVIESTIQAALVLERPWLGREGEHVALGVAYAQNGSPARRRASVAGESLLAHESLVELSWRVPVTSRLVLQPDLHYIFNPGSRSGLKDAFALGLRVELDLTPH